MFAVTKETNTRLLKSLVIIVSINIGGYLISLSFYQLFFLMMEWGLDFVLIWQISFASGISLNMAVACNAPVLYYTRQAYFCD